MFLWGEKKRMSLREAVEFRNPQHPPLGTNNQGMWQRDVPEFRTSQQPSFNWEMGQREPPEFRTPQHPSYGTNNRGMRQIELPVFKTTQHPSYGTNNGVMRLRQLVEFRTPQHPSLGTNNWGGSSPLLARDIPTESLEQRYRRLNAVHIHDEIFGGLEDESEYVSQGYTTPKHQNAPKPRHGKRGFLLKLIFRKKEKDELGSGSKKKRWFPRWDRQNRWPQGWG